MSGRDKPKDSVAELAVVGLAVFVVMFTLIWFLASHRIVFYTAEPLRWMAWPYLWVSPSEWQALTDAANFYRQRPRDIGLVLWLRFVNACLLPTAIVLSLLAAAHTFVRILSKRGTDFKRQLDPMATAKLIALQFPNILPVLHLGPDLVADKLPLWRRQTFPEEIWLHEKIAGRPMASAGRLDLDAVHTWFRGGERAGGPHQMRSGRRWSRTLGFQVVNLIADAPKQQSICFPDRFSSPGKVVFGLLAAHAFGGREGKADYERACAEISRTCAGQANGLPNLVVAQWIYSKYRMHPMARDLFAVHHWEYTYLYRLFILAKLTGKATHTDWIWLKPVNRMLWYALNSVGRATPHAEAAAAFAMVDYETKCARLKRLPLRFAADGSLEHHIHVLPAVEALASEFERWTQAVDSDDGWWRDSSAWKGALALAQQREELAAFTQSAQVQQVLLREAGPSQETPFDMAMRAQAQQKDELERQRAMSLLSQALGAPEPAQGGARGKSAAGQADALDFLN